MSAEKRRASTPHNSYSHTSIGKNNPFSCIFRAHRGGAKIGAAGRRRGGGNLCEWLCEFKSLNVKIYNKKLLYSHTHNKVALFVII